MTGARVLRVYHSAVVPEFRNRDRLLRDAHGYDLHLVTAPQWSEGGSLVDAAPDDLVPLHVVPTAGARHPILFWYRSGAFRRVLQAVRPQVVDLHEEPYSLAVASALRDVEAVVPGARVCVYTAQNVLKRYPPPFRQLEGRALRRADAAYPCSSEAGEVLEAKGFTGPVHVLPLGVSPRSKPLRPDDGPTLRVGFLGRLEPYKGGDVAVRAFAAALGDSDAVLEVVGAGSQRDELLRLTEELGISHRTSILDAVPQEEALARIAGYDVVLVPSRTTKRWKEQFGRIPAQAMEAGVPVIASDSGSLREVLAGSGILVPEGDVEALAAALRQLLEHPERRAELAALGRRRAAEHLSWQRVAAGFDAMYQGVLSG